MAISENDLHPYVKMLVEKYGELTVTELDILLRDILDLDEDDLTQLSGRKDDRFSQIIRNLVSHAPKGISTRDGYILDKRTRPAKFYAFSSKNYNSLKLEQRIITENEIRERRNLLSAFRARIVDFKEVNRVKQEIGDAGELFVLNWEQNRLRELKVNFNVEEEVIHYSKIYGDGAGFDILSRSCKNFSPVYIEVKTTTRGVDEPFYITSNEKSFLDIHKNVKIYRVYNFNKDTMHGEIQVINKKNLQRNYSFNASTYRVSLK